MRAYRPHAPLVAAVWQRLEARIAAYPRELRRLGGELLASLDGGARTYFSTRDAPPLLYLPLWAGPSLPRRRRLELVEGTALTYLFVRIQDDVIDEPGARGRPEWLLLGNALLWDGFTLLGFGAWPVREAAALRRAWLLFCDQTEAERRQVRQGTQPYSEPRFRAHARRHAMAELPLHVALHESGQGRRAKGVPEFVAELGRAYAWVNDLRGLDRDLATGHRTHLIDRVKATLTAEKWGNRAAIRRALTEGPLAARAIAQARRHHLRAGALGAVLGLGTPLIEFTAERVAHLDELALQAKALRRLLAGKQSASRAGHTG